VPSLEDSTALSREQLGRHGESLADADAERHVELAHDPEAYECRVRDAPCDPSAPREDVRDLVL
jgi:hypothetical protein